MKWMLHTLIGRIKLVYTNSALTLYKIKCMPFQAYIVHYHSIVYYVMTSCLTLITGQLDPLNQCMSGSNAIVTTII